MYFVNTDRNFALGSTVDALRHLQIITPR